MRMPVPHVMKSFFEQSFYFSALSSAIRRKGCQCTAVRSSRSRRALDPNGFALKAREELASRLAAVGMQLSMAFQMTDHRLRENEDLA